MRNSRYVTSIAQIKRKVSSLRFNIRKTNYSVSLACKQNHRGALAARPLFPPPPPYPREPRESLLKGYCFNLFGTFLLSLYNHDVKLSHETENFYNSKKILEGLEPRNLRSCLYLLLEQSDLPRISRLSQIHSQTPDISGFLPRTS